MAAQEWLVISERELGDERPSGGFLRLVCHIHGGDNQRSLSINSQTGFGECFSCGAKVLVREINPDAAANIERHNEGLAQGEIRVRDPRYIARAACAPKPARVVTPEQQREIEILRSLHDSMQSCLGDERPRAYIEGRGLRLDTAMSCGVGYVPIKEYRGKWEPLNAWRDHIVFPTWNPETGQQFAGRKLWLWQPGMDEDTHGALLKQRRLNKYHKTHNNGWFNYDILNNKESEEAIFCEGPFDSLALLEGGFLAVSIVGTALEASWVPKHIKRVTLALDADEPGRKKAEEIRKRLYIKGFDSVPCCPPDDDRGKDWSARYRLHGSDGLTSLLER